MDRLQRGVEALFWMQKEQHSCPVNAADQDCLSKFEGQWKGEWADHKVVKKVIEQWSEEDERNHPPSEEYGEREGRARIWIPRIIDERELGGTDQIEEQVGSEVCGAKKNSLDGTRTMRGDERPQVADAVVIDDDLGGFTHLHSRSWQFRSHSCPDWTPGGFLLN